MLVCIFKYGHEGDGYTSKSPHTAKEKFEGLHILEAAEVRQDTGGDGH